MILQKKDVSILKKQTKLQNTTIDRICGCLVGADGNIKYSFNSNFLSLADRECEIYLQLLKKSLSGKINNNLLLSDMNSQEKMETLLDIEKSNLQKSSSLEDFFLTLINSYPNTGRDYCILLFLGTIDLPKNLEVHQCMHCIICPIKLPADALEFTSENGENNIALAMKRATIANPELGFTYPALVDQSTDVHHVLLYVKNTKSPAMDTLTSVLGCDEVLTSSQKMVRFANALTFALSEKDATDLQIDLYDSFYDDECANNYLTIQDWEKIIARALENKDSGLSFLNALQEEFPNMDFSIADILDYKKIESIKRNRQNEILTKLLCECAEKLSNYSEDDLLKKIKTQIG